MNYMPKVLLLLDLEVGEKFNIEIMAGSPFFFDENYKLIDKSGMNFDEALPAILRCSLKIEKLPWKPKEGETYFIVREDGEIEEVKWENHIMDYYAFNIGNYFATEEEITPEIKQRILNEMKGKYENDI